MVIGKERFANETEQLAFLNKVRVVKGLCFTNITRIFELFEDERSMYMVTE